MATLIAFAVVLLLSLADANQHLDLKLH